MLSRSASAAVAAAVRRAGAGAGAGAGAVSNSAKCAKSGSAAVVRRPRAVHVSSFSSATSSGISFGLQAAPAFPAVSTSASAPRCFSTSTTSIPTRHSRHVPRPVCTDSAELESTTASLLASRPGSLFTYEFNGPIYNTNGGKGSSSSSSSSKADEYEAGLARSDTTTQKFEWTLGGHAAAIPGTIAAASAASASAASADNSNTKQHLDAMVELLERIEEEGRIYVELRARVLNQHYSDDNSGGDSSSSSDSSDSDSDTDTNSTSSSQSQSAWRIQSLINRYGATPGPSVYMYDALLDAIACCAEAEQDNNSTGSSGSGSSGSSGSSMEYLALARSVYERAMARHHADGGPNANNRLTMPTHVTYNAVLRTCAAVQYDTSSGSKEQVQVQVRDAALDLAFVVYDALNANAPSDPASTSNAVSKNKSNKKVMNMAGTTANTGTGMPQRNSATYAHMLRLIAKYLPPSPTRGNVAYGLWLSCTGHDGVLDHQVIQAYVEANTRNGSNGKQYDAFVAKVTSAGAGEAAAAAAAGGGANGMQENDVLRQNWWRNRKSRRMMMNVGEGMADYY